MTPKAPYHGPRKLVLAFDVGTTYSGISYCILQPGQVPEMRGVTRFPHQPTGQGNAKVPSVLFYDMNGHVQAVGSATNDEETIQEAEIEGWIKAEWWKLHLRPRHLASTHIKDNDLPKLPPGKSAVDVLTDFIGYLFNCAKQYIEEHHIGVNWPSIKDAIEFVFTHPNGWEGLQQQQYRDAIERAGLIPPTPQGQSRVHMITEGEASLHYCVSTLPEKDKDAEPEGLVIIDAGGGTIDLSMYTAKFNPVSCEETAPAECHLQGAVFVTQRARDLLKSKLYGSPYCRDEEMDIIMRDFDQKTKPKISSPAKRAFVTIGNPLYEDERYKISRGALALTGAEATSLFEPSIKAIIDAFVRQRKSVKTKTTMAFLVGGLGTNDFVWSRLRSYFEEHGINVSRPENDINKSVANGAVLFYVDRAVRVRVARATYGVKCFQWVDESNPEHQRRRAKWEEGVTGKNKVEGHFKPILCKGDQIGENKETRQSLAYYGGSMESFCAREATLYCYRGTLTNPRWIDEDPFSFGKICTIRADLSKAAVDLHGNVSPSGEIWHKISCDVVAYFGTAEWTVQIAWKSTEGEQRTPAEIIYYDA